MFQVSSARDEIRKDARLKDFVSFALLLEWAPRGHLSVLERDRLEAAVRKRQTDVRSALSESNS
jgi:hypothetical protein